MKVLTGQSRTTNELMLPEAKALNINCHGACSGD